MDSISIDPDIPLDFFFDRKPFSDDAAKILGMCEKGEIKAYVTPVIISNVYYLLKKTATQAKVISNLKKLLAFVEVATINKEIIIDAMNSEFTDFEDALQNYAAAQAKEITIIITRNIKHYKKSNLAVMSPETYLGMIWLFGY